MATDELDPAQIEAAARALWNLAESMADREDRYSWDCVLEHALLWPDAYGPIRDDYLTQARAALTAAAQVQPRVNR